MSDKYFVYFILQDHHQQRPSHRHCHINDQLSLIVNNEIENETATIAIEMNWYVNVKENQEIVAIWVIIIPVFQRHGVHRALANRHAHNGLDIRMAGARAAQHLDPVPVKVWSHPKVVAINVLRGIHYRHFDKIAV